MITSVGSEKLQINFLNENPAEPIIKDRFFTSPSAFLSYLDYWDTDNANAKRFACKLSRFCRIGRGDVKDGLELICITLLHWVGLVEGNVRREMLKGGSELILTDILGRWYLAWYPPFGEPTSRRRLVGIGRHWKGPSSASRSAWHNRAKRLLVYAS